MDNEAAVTEVTQDQKNMGLIVWIGSILTGFVAPLIMFLVKKDDEFIVDQAKEALNWGITVTIAWIISSILTFVLIGFFLMPIILLANLVFCVLGAMAVSKGVRYRLPFTLRLIK